MREKNYARIGGGRTKKIWNRPRRRCHERLARSSLWPDTCGFKMLKASNRAKKAAVGTVWLILVKVFV